MASRVKLNRVRKGDKILAADWDRLCDLLEAIANVRVGPGLTAKFDLTGLLISLTGIASERFAIAKITAAPPPSVAVMPANCKYSYKGLDKHGVDEVDQLPIYGRQVENEETAIYPAKVGHLCMVFLNPQDDGTKKAELIVFTESPVRGPC